LNKIARKGQWFVAVGEAEQAYGKREEILRPESGGGKSGYLIPSPLQGKRFSYLSPWVRFASPTATDGHPFWVFENKILINMKSTN